MASVRFAKNEQSKYLTSIYNVEIGTYFYGQISKEIHIKTSTGSVRLSDGALYTVSYLNNFGPVEVVPDGTISITI